MPFKHARGLNQHDWGSTLLFVVFQWISVSRSSAPAHGLSSSPAPSPFHLRWDTVNQSAMFPGTLLLLRPPLRPWRVPQASCWAPLPWLSASMCAVGAELSTFHGVLRQQTQRQEAHLALPPVQRRAGDQLLQEQVRCRRRSSPLALLCTQLTLALTFWQE